jgi:hypothetical protein
MEDNFNLSICVGYTADLDLFDSYLDDLIANNFTDVRISLRDYTNNAQVEITKSHVEHAISKGLRPIWGVSAASLTAADWANYVTAVTNAATWAEANGVYEFQIGNELENINDDTTLTDGDVRTNLKALATDIQLIFTRGKISYSCPGWSVNAWCVFGKGDIDILAANIYRGGLTFDDEWKTRINQLFDTFGADGTYASEFSVSSTSLDSYSTDETTQLNGVTEMVNYIKNSGLKTSCYFAYEKSDEFGVKKADGTYRKLWDVLKITNDWKLRKTASKSGLGGLSHG